MITNNVQPSLLSLAESIKRAAQNNNRGSRYLLGIVGPPASGKSTLAKTLAEILSNHLQSAKCICIPMDGFHKTNAELVENDLLSVKGAPNTFDVEDFIQLLSKLRNDLENVIYAPKYDRALHDPLPNALQVNPDHRIVLVEGNYLLLDIDPWRQCKSYLDDVWYVDLPLSRIRSRLIKRHRDGGKSLDQAHAKVETSDIPNVRIIESSKTFATKIIQEIDSMDLEQSSDPPEIVGLGVATLDILSLVERFPLGREVIRSHEVVLQGGGPVATALATASTLGAHVAHIDAIGDDWIGRLIDKSFFNHDVRRTYLQRRENCASSLSSILVRGEDAARAIVFNPGSMSELRREDVSRDLLNGAKMFHCNGRHLDAAIQMVHWAKEKGICTSFDGGAGRFRPELLELVRQCDICIVAREFAEKLSHESSVEKSAAYIHNLGPSLAGITCGAGGSYIHRKGDAPFWQKAFVPTRSVDTTGCGDSYHGAFLFGHLVNLGLRETAELASAVAALNCSAVGGRGHLPTLADVRDFLRNASLYIR
jgi:sulfofructose kinase